jgi:hypothetical protein
MVELLSTWNEGYTEEAAYHEVIAGILTLDLLPHEAVVLYGRDAE